MAMPNYLIIGAAKSGTTSLYLYLKQHPQIYMSPIKEPYFFALEGEKVNYGGPDDGTRDQAITSIDDYRSLFRDVSNERAIGEASNLYLYHPEAPRRIRHYVPRAKLIAILRNPVDRAYSNFLYMTRRHLEPIPDFAEALDEEQARIDNSWSPSWHYRQRGFYYIQLRRYFDLFDDSQIGVWLYEDLCANPLGLVQSICQFLGVDDQFAPDVSKRHNISGLPRNTMVREFLRKSGPMKAVIKPLLPISLRDSIYAYLKNLYVFKPPLPLELRMQLVDDYREDILSLEDLIKRDLSRWLN